MKILRQLVSVAFVWVAVSFVGCGEDETVAPPSPPPQISLQRIVGMESDDVFDVFVDSQNRLWVSTEAGVYQFKSPDGPFDVSDTSKVRHFTDRDGIPNKRCRAISELGGKIYVATWGGGLGIYSGSVPWQAIRPADGFPVGRVFDLAPDDTSMWVATVAGVFQYRDKSGPVPRRLIDRRNVFGEGRFSAIVSLTGVGGRPDSGQVWVSEEMGDSLGVPLPGGMRFLGLPAGRAQYFHTKTSAIPSDDVAEVSYDAARALVWSAHLGRGVASLDLPTKSWRRYTTASGLVSDLATSVAVNHLGHKWPVGTVWVGTQAGLTKMDPDLKRTMNYASGSGLPGTRVRKVVVDRNDDVWLCFVEAGAAKVLR